MRRRGRRGIDPAFLEGRPDGRGGDGDAESREFAVDASVAPRRVLAREAQDQLARRLGGGWSSGPVCVGPSFRDESSMPPQNCRGRHQEARPAVATNGARQRGEDGAVGGFEPRSSDLALQYGELVAQHQDLGVLGTVASTAQNQQVDDQAEKAVETPHAPIFAASAEGFRCRREIAGHEPGRVIGTHTSSTILRACSCCKGVANSLTWPTGRATRSSGTDRRSERVTTRFDLIRALPNGVTPSMGSAEFSANCVCSIRQRIHVFRDSREGDDHDQSETKPGDERDADQLARPPSRVPRPPQTGDDHA
jgi:hypothetical protein